MCQLFLFLFCARAARSTTTTLPRALLVERIPSMAAWDVFFFSITIYLTIFFMFGHIRLESGSVLAQSGVEMSGLCMKKRAKQLKMHPSDKMYPSDKVNLKIYVL